MNQSTAAAEGRRGRAVIFLSQCFWPEQTATAELLGAVAFALAERDIRVSAIAGQPAYRRSARLPRRLQERGVSVRRVRSTRWDKNRAAGRVANTVTFAVSALGACLFRRPAWPLLAVTNPPLLPWVARAARGLRGTPYALIIHDIYPQIAVALGRLRSGGPVERLWRALNRWAYRGAARIVVLGECMAEVLRGELPPSQQEKVVVIPNWADGDAIRPRPVEGHPLLAEWGCANRFIVQYSGNIGLFHEIETIIDGAERLRGGMDVHFVFIGDGGQRPHLEKAVAARRLANVTLLPFQPKERLPLTLTACHAGLVTLRQQATGYSVPSKLYGIMAAGKPVVAVANERCEVARVVGRHGCGTVVRPGDVEGFCAAILGLKDNAGLRRQMGEAARKACEENYTLRSMADRYLSLIEQTFGG